MTLLDGHEIETLLQPREGPCVSLFLPTTPTSAALADDQGRLRGLIRQARKDLGGANGAADAILAPLDALASGADDGFRARRALGLAAFAAPGFHREYAVPHAFDEHVGVGPFFALARLLPVVQDTGSFHVLALSRNAVRLLACTRDTVERVPLPDVPASLDEALSADDPERSVQYHAGSGPGGHRSPMYHGQGAAKDADADRVKRWFQVVARGVAKALPLKATPVVAALVASHLPVLRANGVIRGLLGEAITGTPDPLSDEELRDRAWPLVVPLFARERERRLAFLRQEAGKGRTAHRVADVVCAAHVGRVNTLFVTRGARRFGRVDPADASQVELRDHPGPGDVDVLEQAVTDTLRMGGRAYAVEPGELPDDTTAAALLRY